MGFELRRQERQELVQHLMAQDWNVFGTLKFVNGRTIGRKTADKLLRSYWNKIGVRLLAELAGHSHISTTQRYIDVNAEQLSEAVELL